MSEIDSFIEKFSGLTEEYKFYDGTVTLRYDPKDHVYLLVLPDGTLERQDGVTTICHILDKSNVLIPWACKMMSQKILATIPSIEELKALSYDSFTEKVNSAKSAHKEKLEDAGYVGNVAHAWIENYIKLRLEHDGAADHTVRAIADTKLETLLANFPAEPRAKNACVAALDWMTRHQVKWLGTERKIYSRSSKYAGTMDGSCFASSCSDKLCCPEAFTDRFTIVDWKTSNNLYIEYILQISAYKHAYEEETGEFFQDGWVIRLGKEDGEFQAWHVPLVLLSNLGHLAFERALLLSRTMSAVEEVVDEMKNVYKAARKAEKKAAKEADLTKQCKGAARYKGIRKPNCNGGKPCEACLAKYDEHQADKLKKLEELASTKTKKKKITQTSPELIKSLNFLLDK
jgi:hypothetical protein